jgi:hypothetical protein
MSGEEMKDLYQRVREMTKDLNITIITPKAPPMTGRPPISQEGPIFIDYLSTLVH